MGWVEARAEGVRRTTGAGALLDESLGKVAWAAQAQASMRSDIVVILAPVGEDDAGFAEGVEQFSVEALGAEARVEGLSVTVLPGAARVDVERLDLVVSEPVLDGLGDKLRAVVGSDVLRCSVLCDSLLQDSQNISSTDGAVGMDAMALAGKLVDEIKAAQFAAALGVVGHEVPGPDMIAARGLLRQPGG